MTERETDIRDSSGGKTPYGWYLDELMGRKHIKNQEHLAEVITDAGHVVSQSQISKIMRGKPQATAAFGNALARGLNMDEEERREHAYLLAYGQDRILSPANRGRMNEYKAQVKEIERQEEFRKRDSIDRQSRRI